MAMDVHWRPSSHQIAVLVYPLEIPLSPSECLSLTANILPQLTHSSIQSFAQFLLEREEKKKFKIFQAQSDTLMVEKVLMIIKGLFRRYERWNPVHPTFGAFWGMGVGIGCGVGWGPGFGPEVIGYVGAGCGIGFNVGITLAGVGIGLPANWLVDCPYNAIMSTRACALELVRSNGLPAMRNITGDGWNHIQPQISGFQRDASRSLSSLRNRCLAIQRGSKD